MKYLHFLNGLAYDSMPSAPCQEKIYDPRKRTGAACGGTVSDAGRGGARGGFGRGTLGGGQVGLRDAAGGFPPRPRGAGGGRGGTVGQQRAAAG